ncbi:heat shock protein Hsp90 [Punctularia strigosozonata HHB-11173 SS5]|uniref:heat shock protein Hsp90 n=1 Tax=Punctularia strigosozonata (strain HHB-11173) TaxID=741275 RepID=UPI0004416ADC|nr:heat shock protein Hsp90 [Punctularia strigosozonata HHB-11173 SS5]EIN10746.1 heat shock protein Hsp90 [Punctularia strigosozonata HHB-11173 SS5]
MRVLRGLFLSLTLVGSLVSAQGFDSPNVPKEKHGYQSDVARLRKIVINSLYSHKDVFLRELISNANDAIEKLRLTALTDKEAWNGSDPLNITIKAIKDEDGPGGRIVITDTGIGMTPEELTTNLGTLAKSGTSDFLARAESTDTTGQGNLIGAFGLGFYSSFLVADKVYVASVAAKTAKNPDPVQYVFSSSADDSSFETFPDPRGNTLGRGTEITLILKEDAAEYLDTQKLAQMIAKHSSFSSAFPIYLWESRTKEVPDEESEPETPSEETQTPSEIPESKPSQDDEDEAIVEDDSDAPETPAEEVKPPKMKSITVEEWIQANPQPPLWMRDPKEVEDDEYKFFYYSTFKDFEPPIAWSHFSGDSGSGVAFKAILYLPGKLPESYWQNPLLSSSQDVKLMVKRTFITSDLGEDALPKWANWVKVVVDAEDLPLNVSRETLQSNKFLKQLRSIILKRLLQLFQKLADEDGEKWQKVQENYAGVLKLGAVEDTKNRDKLIALCRFHTNQRNSTSLDQYLENKKQGQKQIFYLADMGKEPEHLAKSVFVEKLNARGYEVLLLNEPLDEILVQNLRKFKGLYFQDVAKAGLVFGDEDLDPEEEKEMQKELTEQYKPLIDWLRLEASNVVRSVVISNRLVTSPVAIVADAQGVTANMERMMSASNKKSQSGFMADFARKQKVLEINPRSPLIEGLLHRIEQLPGEGEERDLEAEDELREVTSILIDGALVRSGFEVPDSNEFFSRVDRVLRRSLGVSENAPTDDSVKPAPPIDPEVHDPDVIPDGPGVWLPEEMRDKMQITMEEIDEDGNVVIRDAPPAQGDESIHDEL